MGEYPLESLKEMLLDPSSSDFKNVLNLNVEVRYKIIGSSQEYINPKTPYYFDGIRRKFITDF